MDKEKKDLKKRLTDKKLERNDRRRKITKEESPEELKKEARLIEVSEELKPSHTAQIQAGELIEELKLENLELRTELEARKAVEKEKEKEKEKEAETKTEVEVDQEEEEKIRIRDHGLVGITFDGDLYMQKRAYRLVLLMKYLPDNSLSDLETVLDRFLIHLMGFNLSRGDVHVSVESAEEDKKAEKGEGELRDAIEKSVVEKVTSRVGIKKDVK